MIRQLAIASALALSFATATAITGCAGMGGYKTATYNSPEEWVAASMKESHLPLATKAGDWSEKKVMATPKGGSIGVRSQFVKQHGTTCHYNVEFTNEGKEYMNATAGLSRDWKREVYGHNSGRLKLEPGKKVTYNDLEARECPLKWGTSTDMATCATCLTTILLVE